LKIIKEIIDTNIPEELKFLINESNELNKILGAICSKTERKTK